MKKSDVTLYPPYFSHYLSLVEEEDLMKALSKSLQQAESFLQSIPTDKFNYKYEPGKWCVTRLLLHVMDAERIFAYRALCIARGEKINLPGFDENAYAAASVPGMYQPQTIIEDYLLNRRNTIHLFQSFSPTVYPNTGSANGYPMQLGAILCAILGHEKHHFNILQERYLKTSGEK